MNFRCTVFLLLLSTLNSDISGQEKPDIRLCFSKLLATYNFVIKLADANPEAPYRKLYESSRFNTPENNELLKGIDTLHLHESYSFQGYPEGQKIPVMTISLLERNMINSGTVNDFKSQSIGIVPNADLFALSNLLSRFEPVYDSLIYLKHASEFEMKRVRLEEFINRTDIAGFFNTGLKFYNADWDYAVPFNIAIIPSLEDKGFTAKAFLNNAVSEVPLSYNRKDILFSVLMHEIYHLIYDAQSLHTKLGIESWFRENPSPNSQYAFHLFNEAVATALGNGFVYEQLNGKTDATDWYMIKYVNLMAKEMYPLVRSYMMNSQVLDKNFINEYIALYDKQFFSWTSELDHILSYRYLLADKSEDLEYFSTEYMYSSLSVTQYPISMAHLERMKNSVLTKVIIVSSENETKLKMIKEIFGDLKDMPDDPMKEFVYVANLKDKTKFILVNCTESSIAELFTREVKNKRLN